MVDEGLGVDGGKVDEAPHVVYGACKRTCAGTGKVGGVRMDPQDHIGSLAAIGMRGDIAQKTIETRNSGEGRGCLFTGEGAGGGEDPMVKFHRKKRCWFA